MKNRKELIQDYKQKKIRMGVFQIRNIKNGKILVGSHANLDTIWNRWKTQLRFGNHPNPGLQKDWNEFGEAHFVYEILDELIPGEDESVDYKKEILILEEMYIKELDPFDPKGYN